MVICTSVGNLRAMFHILVLLQSGLYEWITFQIIYCETHHCDVLTVSFLKVLCLENVIADMGGGTFLALYQQWTNENKYQKNTFGVDYSFFFFLRIIVLYPCPTAEGECHRDGESPGQALWPRGLREEDQASREAEERCESLSTLHQVSSCHVEKGLCYKCVWVHPKWRPIPFL